MTSRIARAPAAPLAAAVTLALAAAPACAQTTDDPFTEPIPADEDLIRVEFVELASIPDYEGDAARTMILVDEPGTERMFVNDMRGPIYSVSYDGATVRQYLDIDDPRWDVQVEATGRERGMQSFAFHPQFAEPGTPGHGKLYTWTDTRNTSPEADFVPGGGQESHHTVLLEWTAEDPTAETYDGGAPRELMRFEQPFGNHNGGQIGFNPFAEPGDPDFGMLYVGSADGGSGGDPLDLAQDPGSAFGKLLRIDPLGSDASNGAYGIPPDNPYADGDGEALPEIYASGVRNPQRFAWDPATGNLFLADVGQSIVEELSVVTPGADLGWNEWEGSFRFVSRSGVRTDDVRGDPAVTYPVAEYDHTDPLLLSRVAVTGVHVYRSSAIPQLEGRVIFGDMPSGEIFTIDADDLPDGGQDPLRRVLLDDGGEAKTLLRIIRETNEEQGREAAQRADLRFGSGPDGRVLLLNKHDGVIRMLVPGDGDGG